MNATLVSIHDVSPRTLAACQRLRDALGAVGVARATLLVIPEHHGGTAVWEDAATRRWLRARAAAGDELAQHGHVHLARRHPARVLDRARAALLTRGEGECVSQRVDERFAMLGPVRRRLEEAVGTTLAGFVAPAWLAPADLDDALAAVGFRWHERRSALCELRTRARIRAPVVSFAGGSPSRVALSRLYAQLTARRTERAGVRRLAIHPCDIATSVRLEAVELATRFVRLGPAVTTADVVENLGERARGLGGREAPHGAGVVTRFEGVEIDRREPRQRLGDDARR